MIDNVCKGIIPVDPQYITPAPPITPSYLLDDDGNFLIDDNNNFIIADPLV